MKLSPHFRSDGLRSLTLAFLASFLAALFLLSTTQAAHAGPGDGGADTGGTVNGGSGGGGCDVVGWEVARNLNGIIVDNIPWNGPGGPWAHKDENRNLSAGGSFDANKDCGNLFNQSHASTDAKKWEDALVGAGSARAGGCYNNSQYGSPDGKDHLVALWYVYDWYGSWASYSGDAVTKASPAKSAIDRTTVGELGLTGNATYSADLLLGRIKNAAKAQVSADNQADPGHSFIIVCVWDTPNKDLFQCSYDPDWDNYIHSGETTPNSLRDFSNCYKECPSNARAHAGDRIPVAVKDRTKDASGRTYANNQDKFNDYCWPPTSYDRWEYGWTHEIWDWNSLKDGGTVGGSGPYNWIVTVTDAGPSVPGQMPWATSSNPAPVGTATGDWTKFYNKYCANPTTGCSPGRQGQTCDSIGFTAAYNAATSATGWRDDPHATVDLDAYHKEALGQGRALTVAGYTRWVDAKCTTKWDQYWKRHVWGMTYYNWSGGPDPGSWTR